MQIEWSSEAWYLIQSIFPICVRTAAQYFPCFFIMASVIESPAPSYQSEIIFLSFLSSGLHIGGGPNWLASFLASVALRTGSNAKAVAGFGIQRPLSVRPLALLDVQEH